MFRRLLNCTHFTRVVSNRGFEILTSTFIDFSFGVIDFSDFRLVMNGSENRRAKSRLDEIQIVEINRNNINQIWSQLTDALKNADFIAVDLVNFKNSGKSQEIEFSGTFWTRDWDSREEHRAAIQKHS